MRRIVTKFRKILNKQDVKHVYLLVAMMVINALLETVSVSLMVPLISLIMSPETTFKNAIVHVFCLKFGINTPKELIILVLVGLIVIFAGKNIFALLLYWKQENFIFSRRYHLQSRLVEGFLKRPYEFFLDATTGEILRVIGGDTTGVFNLLTELLELVTEIIVSISLVIVVFLIEPRIAVIVSVILCLLIFIISKIVKPIIKKISIRQMKNATETNKWAMQFVAGIKEIKVAKKENFFKKKYCEYASQMNLDEKKNVILGKVPKLLIETVCICGALATFIILICAGGDIGTLLPQLSAFAVAAVRLIPSANRTSYYVNQLSYNEPLLDKMVENISKLNEKVGENFEKNTKKSIEVCDAICLKDVSFEYPNTDHLILDHADMKIPIGSAVGVIGISGAGKTTAIDILLCLLKPQSGRVMCGKTDVNECTELWLKEIGYIPQNIYMLDDTILSNVAFGIDETEIDMNAVWRALEEAQLDSFVKNLPEGLKTKIGERGVRISGGQRQRIGIARALYANPSVLFFDEATSALDNETESAIMESINMLHGKKTLIIIAHRLETIKACDIVYTVKDGKINETERRKI